MLCQCCGKNPAVIYIKTISNGEITKYSLCAECAQELGYGNLFTGLGYNFEGILKEFFTEGTNSADFVRCKCCGASFSDIVRSGKAGCAECYSTFYDRLLPLLQQIHGNAAHVGKTPGGSLPQLRSNDQLSVTHRKLRVTIDNENFEQTTVLRENIKRLKEGGSGG